MSSHPFSHYYESLFSGLRNEGRSPADAADEVATAFLDGKPQKRGKHKTTAADRHAAFWSANFLNDLPHEAWVNEPMVLALARYMGQDRCANAALIEHVAAAAPEAVRRAARYSGLVLRQHSPRWSEIESLARSHPVEFGEFIRIFEIFDQARRERGDAVALFQQPLAGLMPLELLAYASLYAFEHLVPPALGLARGTEGVDLQAAWEAINGILAWKLTTRCGACWSVMQHVVR